MAAAPAFADPPDPLDHVNLGLGAEYTATRIRLDDKSDGANLDMNLNDPSVSLRARF